MRVLIVLVALIALLAIVGWITFSDESGRTSINLETDEIREDTGQMMHEGSELLKEAEEKVAPSGDADTTATSPTTP